MTVQGSRSSRGSQGTTDAPFASRRRQLLGMAVLAAALGAFVFAVALPRIEAPKKVTEARPLIDLPPADFSAIEIERGRKDFRLVRNEGAWDIEEADRTAPVPDDRVEEFLASFAELPPLVEIGTSADVPLADFGLAPARDRVTLHRTNGEEIQLRIGGRNPPLTGVYVEIMPGGQVVLVGAVLLLEIDKLAALASREASE